MNRLGGVGQGCPAPPLLSKGEGLMTGPEHYTEAERLRNAAVKAADNPFPHLRPKELLAAAQVHATLALAAVHAMSAPVDGDPAGLSTGGWRAWNRVAGES